VPEGLPVVAAVPEATEPLPPLLEAALPEAVVFDEGAGLLETAGRSVAAAAG